jgi:CRP-like cAMP-binding protein
MPRARRPTVKNSTIAPEPQLTVDQALRGVPWLAPLGEAAIEHLAPRARLRGVAQGEVVLRQGAPVRHLVIVVSGWLEVGLTSHGGRRLVLDQVAFGGNCGLAGLLHGQPSMQDARAGVDSQVLLLPRAALLDSVKTLPGLAEVLLRLLAHRVRSLLSAYANRSLVTLAPRVATLLLRLARGAGPDQALNQSQEDLAAMLGVTRQALSPVLKQMERDGLIELAYRRLRVLDPAGLGLLRQR